MSDATSPTRNAGRYFEQFAVGDAYRHAIRRTITETDNVLFSTLTCNADPLHIDRVFAADAPYGACAVNSLFVLGLVCGIGATGATQGLLLGNLGLSEVRFTRPVFIGDTIHAESEVVDLRDHPERPDAGILELESRAYNQRNEVVAKFRCLQWLPRREPPRSGALTPIRAMRTGGSRATT